MLFRMSMPSAEDGLPIGRGQGMDGTNRLVMAYKGQLTEEVISNTLGFIEQKIKQFAAPARIRRKVFSVLVEALQNIFWHGRQYGQPLEPEAEVQVYQQGEDYLLVTGNWIEAHKAVDLKRRVELISAMSQDELNDNYRRILATKAKTSPQGSGVGMLDIARRTGNKIELIIDKIEGDYYYCTLNIKIGG